MLHGDQTEEGWQEAALSGPSGTRGLVETGTGSRLTRPMMKQVIKPYFEMTVPHPVSKNSKQISFWEILAANTITKTKTKTKIDKQQGVWSNLKGKNY